MLHTLSRSLRENKGPALVTVSLSALEVVFEIVIPLFMSNLIDFGIEGGSMAAVWKFAQARCHGPRTSNTCATPPEWSTGITSSGAEWLLARLPPVPDDRYCPARARSNTTPSLAI